MSLVRSPSEEQRGHLTAEERLLLAKKFSSWLHPAVRDRSRVAKLGDGSLAEASRAVALLERLLDAPTPKAVRDQRKGEDPWAALARDFRHFIREHLDTAPRNAERQSRAVAGLVGKVEPLVAKCFSLLAPEHYEANAGLGQLVSDLRKVGLFPFPAMTQAAFESEVGWDTRSSFENAVRDVIPVRNDAIHRAPTLDARFADSSLVVVLGLIDHNQRALDQLLPSEGTPPPSSAIQFPEVLTRQEGHLRTFVGREADLARVCQWIDLKDEGGYQLIVGEPGLGKSAFLAELARRLEQAGRACVFHMAGTQRDPHKLLVDLVRRASSLLGQSGGVEQGSIDDLRQELVRHLSALGERDGGVVLLVDALDELDENSSDRLAFLPQVLPRGVRAVLTSRDDPWIRRALARHDVHREELKPLDDAALRLMLVRGLDEGIVRQIPPEQLSGVQERTQGNPLLMQLALPAIQRAVEQCKGDLSRLDLSALRTSFEDLFDGTIARIQSSQDGIALRLTRLLALAREPLGVAEVADLAGLDIDAVRRSIEAIAPSCLRCSEDRYEPFHESFREHLIRRLGSKGRASLEATFCQWLERDDVRESGYALDHRIHHLLGAGKAEAAAALLLDRAFLEAKTGAQRAHQLPSELSRVGAALPVRDERRVAVELIGQAIRHDLRTIQQHPSALFQCLWNRLWWHDAPEAAHHYEPLGPGSPGPWETANQFPLPRGTPKTGQSGTPENRPTMTAPGR